MRFFLLAVFLLLLGCVSQHVQECPGCECNCPQAPQEPAPENDSNQSECYWMNVTVIEEETGNKTEYVAPPPEEPQPDEGGSPDSPFGVEPGDVVFGSGKYVLVLEDVSVPLGDAEPCAMFKIIRASGEVLDRKMICPSEEEYWTDPDGQRFRILVLEVAAGFTKEGRWADVRVFG